MAKVADTSAPATPVAPDGPYLSVVLPAYNEAESLGEVVATVVDICTGGDYEFEVIVVDDGSTDETAERGERVAALYDEVQVVKLLRNFGQSAALAAGFDRARGEVIIPMDADGQNDPGDIPALLTRLEEGHDCVSGWRRDRDDSLAKRIPSAVQTRLATLTGPDIHDFGCTLTAYRAEAIAEVDLRGERHRYIPAQLHELGYDVTELAVTHHAREHGESHYGVGRLVRGFVDLVYHIFRTRYRARPMHIFGAIGLVTFGLGVGLGGWLVVQRYVFEVALLANLPKLLLSISLSLFGFGLFALGIVTELLTELLYANDRPYRVDEVVE